MRRHRNIAVTFSSYSIAICCISADCIPMMEPRADDDSVTCGNMGKQLILVKNSYKCKIIYIRKYK